MSHYSRAGKGASCPPQSAVQARDRLMADLAHDLRSPLNGIQGWTFVLESRLQGADDLFARALQGIMLGIQQQVLLIAEFSDLQQVLTGSLIVHPDAVSINTVVHDALRELEGHLRAHQLESRVEIFGEILAHVDAERLTRALQQLMEVQTTGAQAGDILSVAASVVQGEVEIIVSMKGSGPEAGGDVSLPVSARGRERFSTVLAASLILLQGGRVRAGTGSDNACTIVLPVTACGNDVYERLRTDVARYAEERLSEWFVRPD